MYFTSEKRVWKYEFSPIFNEFQMNKGLSNVWNHSRSIPNKGGIVLRYIPLGRCMAFLTFIWMSKRPMSSRALVWLWGTTSYLSLSLPLSYRTITVRIFWYRSTSRHLSDPKRLQSMLEPPSSTRKRTKIVNNSQNCTRQTSHRLCV